MYMHINIYINRKDTKEREREREREKERERERVWLMWRFGPLIPNPQHPASCLAFAAVSRGRPPNAGCEAFSQKAHLEVGGT